MQSHRPLCFRMFKDEEDRRIGEATWHEGSRIAMQRIVVNLDARGICKDLFVQFVGDGCLLDKARDKPDLVWSTLHNSIKNNIRLFLNWLWLFLNIREDSRSTADCAVYFLTQPFQSLCSQCTPTNSHLFFIYLFKILPFISTWPSPYNFRHISPIGASRVVTFMHC